jgi:hypothetical protein
MSAPRAAGELAGKVTGGASGIGAAAARAITGASFVADGGFAIR